MAPGAGKSHCGLSGEGRNGMGIFTEGVRVQRSDDGAPLRLLWREQWWDIAVEPLYWFERRPWWEREKRMPPGAGAGLVDSQIWRFQICCDAQWRTLDVVQQQPGNRWRVIKIYDAVDDVFREGNSA